MWLVGAWNTYSHQFEKENNSTLYPKWWFIISTLWPLFIWIDMIASKSIIGPIRIVLGIEDVHTDYNFADRVTTQTLLGWQKIDDRVDLGEDIRVGTLGSVSFILDKNNKAVSKGYHEFVLFNHEIWGRTGATSEKVGRRTGRTVYEIIVD